MPIQFDNFDQQKIDRLKNHLVAMAEKGKAKYYEVFVDGLKAVPKTDEPSEFDGYEDYMTIDTEQIRITIYNSASSPRNDQYVFMLKARSRDEANNIGLNGFQVKSYSKNSISDWRQQQNVRTAEQMEIAALKKENAELRNDLQEAEEYADKLANAVEAAKANGNKIGGVHWGEVFSVAIEGLVRRNTHIIAQIPAVSGLAGIIEKDNNRIESPQENAEVSFKKKESSLPNNNTAPALTEQEQAFVNLMRELEKLFTEDEMGQIMQILDTLSKDKTQLQPVAELLNETEEEQEEETNH